MPDDDFILKEICTINGINIDNITEDGPEVEKLEMFFSGYPYMVHLQYFPHLQELKIVSQEVSVIQNLDCCPSLKKLWICECQLTEISHLEVCPDLRYLYLCGNKITKIQKLECLECLECLWLNDNEIKVIDGLSTLKILTELNLSGNQITHIGNAFERNISLEKLSLSGNRISSLHEVTNLISLVKLKELNLAEPQYASNPMCSLFNYATFLLYHLPQLSRLDSFDVTGRRIKEDAEALVTKKKMFYSMRRRTFSSNFEYQRRNAISLRDGYLDRLRSKLDFLEKCAAFLQGKGVVEDSSQANEMVIANGEKLNVSDALEVVAKHTGDVQKELEHVLSDYEKYCSDFIDRDETWYRELLNLELTTCGNVQIREGKPSQHPWHKLCCDLLTSRCCLVPYNSSNVQNLEVHRVIRVSNRALQVQFDGTLEQLTDHLLQVKGSSEFDLEAELRKHQDYLFWCPHLDSSHHAREELLEVLEHGFMGQIRDKTVDVVSGKERLIFSNSVNRVIRSQYGGKPERDLCREGVFLRRKHQILVVRALVDHGNHGELSSRVPPAWNVINEDDTLQFSSSSSSSHHPTVNHNNCQCQQRHKGWILSDVHRVVPEFLIDFSFAPSSTRSFIFHKPTNGRAVDMNAFTEFVHQIQTECPSLSNMKNVSKKLENPLNLDTISKYFNSSVQTITELNLCNSNLSSICNLQTLTALKVIDLSHNCLVQVDCLNGTKSVERVHLQFNRVSTLQGLQCVHNWTYLDLRWNSLLNVREEISILHNFVPLVESLYLQPNYWRKPVDFRMRIVGRLKQLQILDKQPISEEERVLALQLASCSRISNISLLEHGRCDVSRPRRLHEGTMSELLDLYSSHHVDRALGETVWPLTITSLCLNGQNLSKLCSLDRLVNLKFASFNENYLTKIEGLGACTQLEELSLEDNSIGHISNINHLSHLKRLYLSRNLITTLDLREFSSLTSLLSLSLNDNHLTSLREVECCRNLLEFYVSNNDLFDSRDVHSLKSIRNLAILDMQNNPLAAKIEHYRLHMLFQLPDLKVLDGESVTQVQINQARELLGGKLTTDYLMDKLNTDRFYDVRELDLPSQAIRCVQLTPTERFINLRSVNLENNNLTHFSGLVNLPNLRVLCLNHNEIESIYPRSTAASSKNSLGLCQKQLTAVINQVPILEHLEVLHLAYNGIKDLKQLQLHLLPSLKALFLQGNEIVQVEGLEELQNLRELVLDQNKIKNLTEQSFCNNWNLRELHMEDNRLRELDYFSKLERLTRLFLGGNRIQDASELTKLDPLLSLVEISLIKNAVARKMMHRLVLIYRLPRLQIIDGMEVSVDEREKAEMYFAQEQLLGTLASSGGGNGNIPTGMSGINFSGGEFSLPGIMANGGFFNKSSSVKIANVNLGSVLVENANALGKTSAPLLGTLAFPETYNTQSVTLRSRGPAIGGGGSGGGRIAVGGQQMNNPNKSVFYYDPTGYIEPASRTMQNKKK